MKVIEAISMLCTIFLECAFTSWVLMFVSFLMFQSEGFSKAVGAIPFIVLFGAVIYFICN